MHLSSNLAVFTAIVLLALTCSANASSRSPHIVLFIADDLTVSDIGPYGAKDVRTPNLDQLASQSMKFNAAFATSPTCTPSRCSLFTGMYPFRNGAHANHSWIREGVKTLPAYMKQLGYRVVIAGKTHIGPREQFEFEYLKGSNVMPPGVTKHVLWTDLNTAVVDELLAKHDQKMPLCLVVCTHSPHVYWPQDKTYDPAKVTLPPYLLDTPETRRARCNYYGDVTHMDEQLGDVVASLSKHGYEQNTLLLFTADQGAQWPFAKWTLYDAGMRTPLIVRWPGVVKENSKTDAMVSLVDVLPTMIEAAGGEAPGADAMDGKSFLPALRGAQTEFHDAVFAANTGDKQMNRSPARAVRTAKYKYILNLMPQTPFKTHISDAEGADGRIYWDSWEKLAKTDAHAKAVVDRYRHRPAEELYDVQTDPFELHNLAADASRAEDLAHLRKRVSEWRTQQGEDLTKVAMPEDSRSGPLPYAE